MFEDILVPIFVCVILPVAIVWIIGRTRQNETNRKTEVMLKAIENGAPIDPDMFKRPEKTPKTIKSGLLEKLTGACITFLMGAAFLALYFLNVDFFHNLLPVAGGIMLAVGVGLFISYFVGKKMLAKEIEAEEAALKQ
jgi:hypothetical protein